MLSEKKLIISTTSFKGSLAEQCRRILDRTDPDRIVLSLVFFFDVEAAGSYDSAMSAITGECRRFFGMRMPMVTCVAQKPLESALSAEVLYLHGNGTVEFNDDYLVIRSGDTSELITKGIQFPGSGDTGEQAARVFARIGEILDGEGFRTGDIVRQWNYIESITGMTGGMQNYQMFNDARSAFYSGTDWTNGYPAATGIGSSAGGVVVSIYAVSGPVKASRPVDNPIQVPAHRYSGRVLVQGRDAVRTTPKFERARLLDDTVLISGTAAIKGENSDISSDPGLQAEAAIDVVEHLVRPGNIFPGCKRFRFGALRIYIKHEEDAGAIISTIKDRWKGVPMHFLVADICRPELLLEIEGTGSVRRFLECCCTDAGEAAEAQEGGAGRIELCEDLPCGGVTPSRENIERVLESVDIPVNVLIRPRGGNFVYDEKEISLMLDSVAMCRELGVNGVVIGALKEDGSVDIGTVSRLMKAAEGLQVTFHRAFDECSDPFGSLEDIIRLGCDRLLTAGHASDVNEGREMLKQLNDKAAGRIIILAGSGVRPANIDSLEESTGITEFHSSSHGADGRTSAGTVALMTGC